MMGLEDRLRERLASVEEPDLVAPHDLLHRVRAAHRRRHVVPIVVGGTAVGALSATLVLVAADSSPYTGSVASPTASAAGGTHQAPCSVERLVAAGGPRSMVHFRWPSGATLVALRTPEQNCPIELMLSTPTIAEDDRAAAEARWGDDVHLVPYDATTMAYPTPTPLSGQGEGEWTVPSGTWPIPTPTPTS